ncbi:glycosyltransferase family 4 protein [Endozoicomonas numazuensis]|uniref:Glycosyl transferase n=1 Tax=Endozoicomonas numazuensis TaxID=1137799 RepID=A0A081N3Q7_9GAMM|nr:glycosyltransferase family 4 protein [Endozoicomonas numazuensis]KEQ13080.1 glycosyl transferase [Endozoicomonas numazuensis]
MKNVWILNHYAQEPGGAGGTRHYSLARHLLSHGWCASVIAASVELNTGRQRLSAGERKRIDHFGGIPFMWVRTPQYKGNGGGRMLNMLTYALRVLIPGVTRELNRPSVVVGSSVHPFTAVAGLILAKRFRVPFVFEVRDLWPQTLVDLGRLREESIITSVLRSIEKWLYQHADSIVVLLPQAAKYIVPLGIPEQKIVWIPNGVELDGYPEPAQPSTLDTFTLMYFGAHGQANGLNNVLKAMAELKKRPGMRHVRLRVIGDGPLKAELIQLARELNLDSVEFEEPVPKQQIPFLAAEADAFVFNLIDSPVFKFGISSNKLFDYLAGGRPILFSCESSNNPIEEAKAGITVPPENPEALAEAITTLVKMTPIQRAAMGHAGRDYVEKNHGFDALGARFATLLNELVSERR